MRTKAILAVFLTLAAMPATALAEGGVRTKEPAALYSGPSEKSPPLAIFESNYPLRSISRINQWEKVETANKLVGWIKSEYLEEAELGVVMANSAEVRIQPQSDAEVVFVAEKSVMLEVVNDDNSKWLQVRHEEGETGYILRSQIWRNFQETL